MRRVKVAPVWIGLGVVRVAEHDPSLCRTTLVTADDLVEVEPGTDVEVTAGAVTARVETEHGAIEVGLEVEPDAAVSFDPTQHLPASLTIIGVPAGSDLEVYVETPAGVEVRQKITVPSDEGTIDNETGVLLAPPQRVFSLMGGSGAVSLRHPTLGQAPVPVVLEAATVNASTYPWESLEGVPRVAEAYGDWKTRLEAAQQGQQRTAALAVLSGVFAGVGAGMLIGSAVEDGRLASTKADGLNIADADAEADALATAWEANQRADRTKAGLLVGGSIGLGLAGAGVVLTFVSSTSAKQAVADVGPWDPASVD